MKSLLTSDAKLVVLTMRLGDLVLLNLCFLLCCLPIVTIAPACSALYLSLIHISEPTRPY